MTAAALPVPTGGDDASSGGQVGHEQAAASLKVGAGAVESTPVDMLLSAAQVLKGLAGVDWEAEQAKAVVRAAEAITGSVTVIQANALNAAETSGTWTTDGQRTFDSWVTSQTGTTRTTAGRAVKLSKSLQEDLPATRKALVEGTISSDHAQIIARRCTTTDNHRKRLADTHQGEEFLIKKAQEMDAGKFSKVARAWAIETDPKAADRQWRRDTAKEEVILAPTDDGYHLSGWLNPVHGALVNEALTAHMGRKAKDDPRSFTQRRAAALVSLASQSLDAGLQMPSARIRPHLTITMDYTTLEGLTRASGPLTPPPYNGPGAAFGAGAAVDEATWARQWQPGEDHVISTQLDHNALVGVTPASLPDGTPIPPKALARLACDSMLTRVIFGPESTVLDVGREQRIFPAHHTRAIIARDRTCRYPGCDEGPGFGEIHHSISWAKHNGTTHVDLGILLCYRHHDVVHERDIAITRRRGHWIFTDRHGHQIHPPGHSPPLEPAPLEAAPMPPAPDAQSAADTPTDTTQTWQQPTLHTHGPPPF